MNEDCNSRGRELYHEIWRTLANRFYDSTRLTDWARWEHLFDEQITDDRSAIEYAQIMVSSLGDRYTTLLDHVTPENGDAIEAKEHVKATRLKCNIGYIAINTFDVRNIVDLTEEGLRSISDCDAYIVDLSDNSGGSLGRAIECLSLFVEQGPLSELQFRTGNGITLQEAYLVDDACLMRIVQPDGASEVKPFQRRKCLVAGKPIALITGPDSASSCEAFIAALLANRRNCRSGRKQRNGSSKLLCWAFGERTSGKGIMQATLDILDGRVQLKVSIGTFKSPDGHWFGNAQSDKRGLRPDYRVRGRRVRACAMALRHLKRNIPVRNAA
jgi:C-terminal processing protease CtpA/Prc